MELSIYSSKGKLIENAVFLFIYYCHIIE